VNSVLTEPGAPEKRVDPGRGREIGDERLEQGAATFNVAQMGLAGFAAAVRRTLGRRDGGRAVGRRKE
jgi:hypothetical protein